VLFKNGSIEAAIVGVKEKRGIKKRPMGTRAI
jgi:hypothetical protein